MLVVGGLAVSNPCGIRFGFDNEVGLALGTSVGEAALAAWGY